MLRRQDLLMCGKGRLGGWEPPLPGHGAYPHQGHPLKGRQTLFPPHHERSFCGGRSGWHPRRRGRHPGFPRPLGRPPPWPPSHLDRGRSWNRCTRPSRARVLLSLRPVNLMGQRAPGMRAPRNTNQFLMREKYQLMHLRSDSVGTESGGSDCEMDPLDMDSYLGVLENARGALLDGLPPPPAPTSGHPTPPSLDASGDNSLPYFPSEDDVIESEIFMERDFHEFCSSIA